MTEKRRKKLMWTPEYSVQIEEIDNQHKKLFDFINELLRILDTEPQEEKLNALIVSLLEYKAFHFKTEEDYFAKFNFEGGAAHILQHKLFGEKIAELQKQYENDMTGLSYALIDFLEDWLVNHLLTVDHQYIDCFKSHGL